MPKRLDQSAKTDKKYTLMHRGRVIINWNDIAILRDALLEFNGGPSTYIRYNETGRKEYANGQ